MRGFYFSYTNEKRPTFQGLLRAGNEIRTRDVQLGKLTLYQLSYSRLDVNNVKLLPTWDLVKPQKQPRIPHVPRPINRQHNAYRIKPLRLRGAPAYAVR